MDIEEIKILGEKMANGSASSEEKLLFLRELNKLTEEMRSDIAQIKINKLTEEMRSDATETKASLQN
ncbi:MAG: hypothetical protein ACOYL8_04845 [Patescibacteria group bacterium]